LSHANARLNEYGRNLAVERYLAGQRAEDIAGQLGVSRTTVYEWIARYAMEGPAGLADRSSRPHRSPRQLPLAVEFQVLKARLELHAGPVQLAAELGLPPSTTGQILRRWAVPHLAELDRITGEAAAQPGHRAPVRTRPAGRPAARRRQEARPHSTRRRWRLEGQRAIDHHSNKCRIQPLGFDYIPVAVEDHSRVV
jgi:transposase